MPAEMNFDANGVAPHTPFTPVPNGEYRAHIVESEMKDAKSSNGGKYLQLVWEILDGEHKGRKLWDRLNIVNANSTAQQIGQAQLSAVCHATGVLKLGNSAQLHHRPVLVRVTVKQSPGYEPANEVKGYKAIAGMVPTAPAAATSVVGGQNAVPAAAVAAPSWAQRKAG